MLLLLLFSLVMLDLCVLATIDLLLLLLLMMILFFLLLHVIEKMESVRGYFIDVSSSLSSSEEILVRGKKGELFFSFLGKLYVLFFWKWFVWFEIRRGEKERGVNITFVEFWVLLENSLDLGGFPFVFFFFYYYFCFLSFTRAKNIKNKRN